MEDYINDYFSNPNNLSGGGERVRPMRKRIMCEDGFHFSVQASSSHYSEPQEDFAPFYSEFEAGYPSEVEELLLPYAEDPSTPTETVYSWVPSSVINRVIEKHGGFNTRINLS